MMRPPECSRSLAPEVFFFSSRRRHTRLQGDWSSDVCSSDLTEWKVELSQATIVAGTVTFTVTNAGSIPHALEVEGQGIEQETGVIQPGASATQIGRASCRERV